MSGVGVLAGGLAVFLGIHAAQWPKGLRAAMVRLIGSGPWKLLYSLLSLAGFALVLYGWSLARPMAPILYEPPVWVKHLALLLMPIAFVLLAAAYTPAGRIKAFIKHPMLTAVKIWAFTHLLANGDAASLLLFGSFLAWAVLDRISVSRRERAGLQAVAVAGRQALLGDVLAVAIGLGAAGAMMLWLHPLWFDVVVWPG